MRIRRWSFHEHFPNAYGTMSITPGLWAFNRFRGRAAWLRGSTTHCGTDCQCAVDQHARADFIGARAAKPGSRVGRSGGSGCCREGPGEGRCREGPGSGSGSGEGRCREGSCTGEGSCPGTCGGRRNVRASGPFRVAIGPGAKGSRAFGPRAQRSGCIPHRAGAGPCRIRSASNVAGKAHGSGRRTRAPRLHDTGVACLCLRRCPAGRSTLRAALRPRPSTRIRTRPAIA